MKFFFTGKVLTVYTLYLMFVGQITNEMCCWHIHLTKSVSARPPVVKMSTQCSPTDAYIFKDSCTMCVMWLRHGPHGGKAVGI